MKTAVLKGLLVLMLCSASAAIPTRTLANDWPMVPGDFWDVTGIHLKDGGALAYANFLATEWKANQEFAKSKGWIKSYMLAGTHLAEERQRLVLRPVTER